MTDIVIIPNSCECMDVVRQKNNLDNLEESIIDDVWNTDANGSLPENWSGSTRTVVYVQKCSKESKATLGHILKPNYKLHAMIRNARKKLEMLVEPAVPCVKQTRIQTARAPTQNVGVSKGSKREATLSIE